MLIKILGIFDLIAAGILFLVSFGLNIPEAILIFIIAVLLLKGAFILTKSIASGFDLFAALILILSFYFSVPQPVYFIAGIILAFIYNLLASWVGGIKLEFSK